MGADALDWMQRRKRDADDFLFRGQSAIHKSIFPSLLRPSISQRERDSWWAVTRRFISARNGIAGYVVPTAHDALGIIQHYLLKSPVIDLTGTPLIALYFALSKPERTQERIVYAVRASDLKEAGLVVCDHTFLLSPLNEHGLTHRWMRQDGFTVGHSEWANYRVAESIDLLRLPGVVSFTFYSQPDDLGLIKELGNLEAVDDDPLASKVRSVFEAIAQGLGYRDIIRKMMPLGTTIDSEQCLVSEIDDLIKIAVGIYGDGTEVKELLDLRGAALASIWDASFDCALKVWTSKLKRIQAGTTSKPPATI